MENKIKVKFRDEVLEFDEDRKNDFFTTFLVSLDVILKNTLNMIYYPALQIMIL